MNGLTKQLRGDMGSFIAWHGTNVEGYKGIKNLGFFKNGTYFARHLEDAIGMGGPYVFAVVFKDGKDVWKHPDASVDWQFRVSNDYSIEHVVEITHYEINSIFKNDELRIKAFEENMTESNLNHG